MHEHYIKFKVVSNSPAEEIADRLSISLILQELGVNDLYIDTDGSGLLSYNLKECRERDKRRIKK